MLGFLLILKSCVRPSNTRMSMDLSKPLSYNEKRYSKNTYLA